MFAPHAKDAYKIGHPFQYPQKTQEVYSNLTARSGKLSNIPGSKGIWVAGIQHFVMDYLIEDWNYTFFLKNKKKVVQKYKRIVDSLLDSDLDVRHIEALHDLGYLPLEIKALPEGVFAPYGVAIITLRNTLPEFYWVTNMIESVLLSEIWLPITSATTYKGFENLFLAYANRTGVPLEFTKYQGHDFSMRGMGTRQAAAISGAAVLSVGCVGTDNIPALELLEEYYDANVEEEVVGKTVNATEHSVMCAGGKVDEYETYRRLIQDIYPKGNISIVSDTWDFWEVVTKILPSLKDIIMNRDGKVIIRPDSGDPVEIICGTFATYGNYSNNPDRNCEAKGLIECLWEIFGGTINDKGYKVLNSHIGAIYGDSITYERAKNILNALEKKGFASSNIVFGLGAYTFQYVTRDTHGIALKSTNSIIDGEVLPIFKDPKTDGSKKSAKGYIRVDRVHGEYLQTDEVPFEESLEGELGVVFLDGILFNKTSLKATRERSRVY